MANPTTGSNVTRAIAQTSQYIPEISLSRSHLQETVGEDSTLRTLTMDFTNNTSSD